MPTKIPDQPRSKVLRDNDDFRRHEPHMLRANEKHRVDTVDWLALWTLSLAFSAVFIASCAFFGEGDTIGASAVLGGTATIVALALRFIKAPDDSK